MPHKDPEEARKYFRERARKVRAADRDGFNSRARRYYHKNRDKIRTKYSPEKHRDWWLQRNYGLTLAAWEALFDGQGRSCAICETTNPGSVKGWHTDHDHETLRVRGILCKQCNTTLGSLGDTSSKILERLDRVREYIA